jgi:HEAT repeat protein
MNDQRAVEPLIKALGDLLDGVSAAAAQALAELKDPRAVEPLIHILENGSNLGLQRIKAAAEALRQLKDPRAVEPLVKALSDLITLIPIWSDGYRRCYS